MPPHGGGLDAHEQGMSEAPDLLPDQGGQLPTDRDAAVLEACYNAAGDVMATASSSGVVQVCVHVQVTLNQHPARVSCCHEAALQADGALGLQVWAAAQGGWRILHTEKVRWGVAGGGLLMQPSSCGACVTQEHLQSIFYFFTPSTAGLIPHCITVERKARGQPPDCSFVAAGLVCHALLLQLPASQPTQLAWAHPQYGQLLAVGTSSGKVHLIQGPAPSSIQGHKAAWSSTTQLPCGKGAVRWVVAACACAGQHSACTVWPNAEQVHAGLCPGSIPAHLSITAWVGVTPCCCCTRGPSGGSSTPIPQ